MTEKRCVAILPTYNERDNVAPLVAAIRALGVEVVVVDDDSPDGTAAAALRAAESDPGVHVIVRKEKRGRGYAGAEGFRWALERGYDLVVEMDADFSHPPEDIPRLIAAAEGADVVIASRLAPGGGEIGRGLSRRLLTRAANALIRRLLGLRVRDCTSGFRCFRREALAAVRPERLFSPGPAIVQEVLYLCSLNGLRIVETPFLFKARAAGKSKLTPAALLRTLADQLRIRNKYRHELLKKNSG